MQHNETIRQAQHQTLEPLYCFPQIELRQMKGLVSIKQIQKFKEE